MIEIEEMKESDLEIIKNNLNEFDDFWNYNILKSEIESENSVIFVAKKDDKIVGFAGIKIGPFEIDIMNIVVRKDMRNNKIGTCLMEKIIDFFKESDKEEITLEVNEKNIPAIKLYEKYGFEKVGIRKKYYGEENAILMSKKQY